MGWIRGVKHAREEVARRGLVLQTTRPGDGGTRYHVERKSGEPIATLLGRRALACWLEGWDQALIERERAERAG